MALPDDLEGGLREDTLGLPDDGDEVLPDETLGLPDGVEDVLPDDTLGLPDDLEGGLPEDTLGLADDLEGGLPEDTLGLPDDLEGGLDGVLRLLDDLSDDATLGLAEELKEGLPDEPFFEPVLGLVALLRALGWVVLFFWLLAQYAQPSPSRLFNSGRCPIFSFIHCIYAPSFDFCLCSGTYFILSSDSLCCLNLPATLLSISCCF